MAGYGMKGTPTLVLIDRQGQRRAQIFGPVPDLRLGAEIMALIAGVADEAAAPETPAYPPRPVCDEAGRVAPTMQGDRHT